MKTIYKITFGILCICGLLLGACTDFEELNTDPSKSSSTDPNQQLSMIQLQTWGHWQMCQPYPFYLAAFAQYMQATGTPPTMADSIAKMMRKWETHGT